MLFQERDAVESSNQLATNKEELDALATEFMDYIPTAVCTGCEAHGCANEFLCNDPTQPNTVGDATADTGARLGVETWVPGPQEPKLDPRTSFEAEGGGSNEDEWEVDTKLEFSLFDLGGEG